MKHLLLLCCIVLTSRLVAADGEDDSLKVYQLKEVLVTATRTERSLNEVGRSVSVVPAGQLGGSIFTSLGEVLARQAGIYVVGAGQNPGMLQSVFMRGAGNNQVAVMVDDIRVTDPSSPNNALDLSEFSLSNVERVEIVRGTHSTLYGSSAIGGVVNLITRKNGKPGISGTGELTTGTLGRGASSFGQRLFLHYGADMGVYISGEVGNSRAKGLDATVDSVTLPGAFNRRDRDGFVQTDFIGKVGFRNERAEVHGSYKRTTQDADIDKGAFRDDDNATLETKRSLLTYGGSFRATDDLHIRYVGGYSTMNRAAVDDSSVVDALGNTDRTHSSGSWRGTTLTNELQASFHASGISGVVGGGHYRETMSSASYFYSNSLFGLFESRTNLDSLDLHASIFSVFGQVDMSASVIDPDLAPLSLVLGGRVYRHSSFGTKATFEVNPRLNVSDNTLLFASYASGFNAPSLYQLFSPESNSLSGISRGNTHLQPEASRSFELGFRSSVSGNISVSASYFHSVVENAIEYVYLWNRGVPIDSLGNDWMRDDFRGDTYLNLGKQTTQGIEFGISARLSEQLWFDGSYSMVSGRFTYQPSAIQIAQTQGNHVQLYNSGAFVNSDVEVPGLVRRPNVAHASLSYAPVPLFAVTVYVRQIGPRGDVYYDSALGPFGALGTVPVEDYTLVDFSARFHFGEHVTVISRLENVFDVTYSEIKGFTTRGRALYLSTRVSI